MKILGNKICRICGELNRKKLKNCQRCGGQLKNTIKSLSASPHLRTKEQFKKDEYDFKLSEVGGY